MEARLYTALDSICAIILIFRSFYNEGGAWQLKKQVAMVLDLNKDIGCRTGTIACKARGTSDGSLELTSRSAATNVIQREAMRLIVFL